MTTFFRSDAPENPNATKAPASNSEKVVLDRQYGAIGISAVAAAMRYGGPGKNPAYARAPETAERDARAYDLSMG